MRKSLLALALLLASATLNGQVSDSLRRIDLREVEIQGKRKVVFAADQGMYAMANPDNDYEQIAGFSSLVILDGAEAKSCGATARRAACGSS